VLVIGGSGDYLDVADRVIRMVDYAPEDVTNEARSVSDRFPTGRQTERTDAPVAPPERTLARGSLDPRLRQRATYVRVPDRRTLLFGRDTIDLAGVEQLVSRAQVRAIGQALVYIARLSADRPLTVPEALDAAETAMREGGLDALEPRLVGDLAGFRRFELAATLNRLRSLCVE
jgi:predicted ABC-class ATPase